MTLYARRDLHGIGLGAGKGCGLTHYREGNEIEVDGRVVWALACPACELVLTGDSAMWSADPERIPLTPDEHNRLEDAAKKGAAEQSAVSNQFGKLATELLKRMDESEVEPKASGSLMSQIAALSDDEKAALAEMLAPAKRKPGRPRKPVAAE